MGGTAAPGFRFFSRRGRHRCNSAAAGHVVTRRTRPRYGSRDSDSAEAPVNRPLEISRSEPVQALGELRALALAQAAERLARRDPAALQNPGCLHAPVLGRASSMGSG